MTTSAAPPDELAAQEFLARLEGLFQAIKGELLGTLYYMLGNLEDVRDAVQETFLKCWRNQPTRDNVARRRGSHSEDRKIMDRKMGPKSS